MHWKTNTRDWPDAAPDQVSWRLVEGLDDLLGTIEDEGGGHIDYVRLRRPPVGNQAKRSKSRYVAWDNLEGCRNEEAVAIARELAAAAAFVSRRDKCGEAFEAQVQYTINGEQKPKSICFNLGDGATEQGNDDDTKDEDEEDADAELTPKLMAKLMRENPILLNMLTTKQFVGDLIRYAETQRRADQSRIDKLLNALLQMRGVEEDLVTRFIKMINPVLVHSADMTKLGFQALTAQAEQAATDKAAEAELEYRKHRMETVVQGFSGLKDLFNGFGLDLLARKMGIDPNDLREAARQSGASASPPPTEEPQPMTPDERNEAIRATGVELRRTLTESQLTAIRDINAPIAAGLEAIAGTATADQVRAAVATIREAVENDKIMLFMVSQKLTGDQQLAVLQLLELVYPTQN